jgi:hypothetical protein
MPQGPSRRTRLILGLATTVVAIATLVAGWLVLSGDGSRPAGRDDTHPSPAVPTSVLVVDVGRVGGYPVAGDIPDRRLQDEAQAVRDTMTGLYTAAFVDPALWAGGRFPTVKDFFGGQAREQARSDIPDLTLGKAAGTLEKVRPEHARVLVRFLLDANRRPVAATAEMEFRGTGFAAGIEVPISHRGRYILRPEGGRWLVVAYEVRGRVGLQEPS